jgi:hypothetical protein
MFFQEVGEEFYEDIRKAANSLVTPEKDTSASQSEEAKKGNETRRAKAGGNREDRKQEILAILSAEPAHAFTLHGVSQRMSYNTLSDPMLRKLLNEGVREGKWERFRYRVDNRYGWCMPNAYRKWHDSQFAEGRTYDPGNRLFLGSDHEQAAWKEEDEKSAKDSAEWLKRFRAEHPEERQDGETDEEYEKRHAAWEKQQRSERAKQAAATRKLNAEKKKEILEKVKGAILGGATTAEAVCAATGMDSDEVDEVLEKLQEQGEEGTELGFEVPKPSWQEGYENEEENQVQSVSGVYTDDHRESV